MLLFWPSIAQKGTSVMDQVSHQAEGHSGQKQEKAQWDAEGTGCLTCFVRGQGSEFSVRCSPGGEHVLTQSYFREKTRQQTKC